MQKINRINIFKAKYIGQTNIRGARVSIKSIDGRFKKTVAYDYAGDILTTVISFITREGYNIIGIDQDSDYYYIAVEVE